MTNLAYTNNQLGGLFLFLLLFSLSTVNAQIEDNPFGIVKRSKTHLDIDKIQIQLDLYDGKRDEKYEFKNDKETSSATELYLTLIDDIQFIIENRKCSDLEKYNDLIGLYNIVARLNQQNYQYLQHHFTILDNAYALIANKAAGTLSQYLKKHPKTSLNNIVFFKDDSTTGDFLIKMADYYPGEILTEINAFRREPYAMKVVEKLVSVAPIHVKQYFNSKNNINTFLLHSEDETVKKLLSLYETYGHESKTYLFLDTLNNNDTLDRYFHELGRDPNALLSALMLVKSDKKFPKAHYNIDQELELLALEFIRVINDMHLMKDASERFASVDSMNAIQLYALMVYSPEEIFTSTFNGLFDRFMSKISGMDGMTFLAMINMNRFRTFIKLCSGYNKLDQFFASMSAASQDVLIRTFVQDLATESGSLKDAVDVADTFGSLEDSTQLNKFAEYMSEAYRETLKNDDRSAQILYGLLLNIINNRTQNIDPTDQMIALAQEIPFLDEIEVDDLFDKDSVNYQQHFFYDDEDGEYSYNTFINTFKRNSSNWKITDSIDYVIISSTNGNKVKIYANKSLSEREGQAKIKALLEKREIYPSIVVHRGHSYYAKNTIEKVSDNARIVFLGSCGGYHNLTSVIDKAASVHIISSKQIGTVKVNNPLLLRLSDEIRKGNNIEWQDFWIELEKTVNHSEKGREKFVDYIPPHKNLGVIFIKAYKSLIG